jgi:general secretion pathway protein E
VFSTLHTNDAVGALPRLIDLGVPEYLIASTLDGVLAQRLVRRTCRACHGDGCGVCRETGFSGRVGIFELLLLTDDLREAIVSRSSRSVLHRLAREAGMVSMVDDGRTKVSTGITTAEEVARIIHT